MPAYHSAYNDVPTEEVATIASLSILPFRSKVRGPAPPPLANPPPEAEGLDIIDEALDLFRPNSLFRNFEIKGGADRLLIYLILFISQCLSIIAGSRVPLSQAEAIRQLSTTAVDQFHLPGDAGFPLNNLYAAPANRMEADQLRAYLVQARQEIATRLIERVYVNGQPSKFWLAFTKRKL
ncbi:hypothetical protein L7F22_003136 [Adiantum nelumboides]|nr:hypothetical protein [Adiantum nelumboides]